MSALQNVFQYLFHEVLCMKIIDNLERSVIVFVTPCYILEVGILILESPLIIFIYAVELALISGESLSE